MNKYELYYKDILIAKILINQNKQIEYKVLNIVEDTFIFLQKDFNGLSYRDSID